MNDVIDTIDEREVLKEAYEMGFFEAEGWDHSPDGEIDLSYFKESARWANILAPRLRALAGFEDAGYGTYTQNREIRTVNTVLDRNEGGITESHYLEDELITQFDNGIYDRVEGEDKYHSLPE